VEAPTARASHVDLANTEPSLASPAPAMKLGASRLGLATVTRARDDDARSFGGPAERTEAVSALAAAAPDVQPLEALATLRARRSLLDAEPTEVHAIAPESMEVHPIAPEPTSLLDVSALPADALDRPAEPARKGRRGTYLPVGGPDAAPEAVASAAPPAPAEVARARVSTAPVELDQLSATPAVDATLDTQRPAVRPSLPSPSPAPPLDSPTDPSIALPPPVVAPPAPAEAPPDDARVPWWIPALAAAALVTLVVAAVSALQ